MFLSALMLTHLHKLVNSCECVFNVFLLVCACFFLPLRFHLRVYTHTYTHTHTHTHIYIHIYIYIYIYIDAYLCVYTHACNCMHA